MMKYKLKLAIISGCYCRTAKVYLQATRRYMVIGYEQFRV
jgi:hypothetical protein